MGDILLVLCMHKCVNVFVACVNENWSNVQNGRNGWRRRIQCNQIKIKTRFRFCLYEAICLFVYCLIFFFFHKLICTVIIDHHRNLFICFNNWKWIVFTNKSRCYSFNKFRNTIFDHSMYIFILKKRWRRCYK